MSFLTALIDSSASDEEGQGLAEYALILALIALVAIAALLVLGPAIAGILNTIANVDLAADQPTHRQTPDQRVRRRCIGLGARRHRSFDAHWLSGGCARRSDAVSGTASSRRAGDSEGKEVNQQCRS